MPGTLPAYLAPAALERLSSGKVPPLKGDLARLSGFYGPRTAVPGQGVAAESRPCPLWPSRIGERSGGGLRTANQEISRLAPLARNDSMAGKDVPLRGR